jgi:hypothetical protein
MRGGPPERFASMAGGAGAGRPRGHSGVGAGGRHRGTGGAAGQPRELRYLGRAYQRALAGAPGRQVPGAADRRHGRGVWHQRRLGRRLAVTVVPGGPLTAAQRRTLDEQVPGVGVILASRPELTAGIVTLGAHAWGGRQPIAHGVVARVVLPSARPRRTTVRAPGAAGRPHAGAQPLASRASSAS